MASDSDNTRNAFSKATVFGAIAPVAIVFDGAAFISTDVDGVLEVDDEVWAATRVVLDVEVVVDVDVVVDVEVVEVVVEVVVAGGSVVLVVEVVEVVDVVVDVVVVVSGVADAATEVALRPLMFSAFTVTAYVEPLVSDPTTHCKGCASLTNVEQPSTPFRYTR